MFTRAQYCTQSEGERAKEKREGGCRAYCTVLYYLTLYCNVLYCMLSTLAICSIRHRTTEKRRVAEKQYVLVLLLLLIIQKCCTLLIGQQQ